MFIVITISAIGTFSAAQSQNEKAPEVFKSLEGSLIPTSGEAQGDEQVVYVGLYGTNVYEPSFEDNTFYFSGYIWMRWLGDIDPTATLEFTNAVETWGLMITPLSESPEVLPSGEFVQTLSVQGRFYESFALADYPLDSQSLSIILEDSTNFADALIYKPDTTMSGLDQTLRVQGFEVTVLSSKSYLHSYGTDFGYLGSTENQTYSALEFQIQIERNPNLFLWKLMLPLLLVLITNWLTLLMNPKYVEVRTAMPATALLTTVFLQLSAMETVSQASTLVLMDKIYLVAYASIVLTLARVIWDNRAVREGSESDLIEIAQRDKVTLLLQAVTTICIFAYLVLPLL